MRLVKLVAFSAGAAILLLAISTNIPGTVRWQLPFALSSSAQPCIGGPGVVATLFGTDVSTQIRLATPDLKTERALRTEPASRLPALFESLLAVSADGKKVAYVTAGDETLDNAEIFSIDVATPDRAHLIASVPSGLLPIRPVWSSDAGQLAYVVSRQQQGHSVYQVLAAPSAGGPAIDLATLSPAEFDRLHTGSLCVTTGGAISLVPTPLPEVARPAAIAATLAPTAKSTPIESPPVGGAAPCAVPVLSQNDPRWRRQIMQPDGDSIGGVGCALTSTAIILNYFGNRLTPDQLSDCLGAGAEPLVWARAVDCGGGRVRGGQLNDFSWKLLDSILAAGRPAIVGLYGGPVGSHFVVVTSGGGDEADRYHIVDPWNGTNTETLGTYTRSNWKLGRIVDYQGQTSGCGRFVDNELPVDGFDDGASYNHPITVRRLAAGVDITIRRMSATAKTGDTDSKLIDKVTLSEEGIYRVIIAGKSIQDLKVLSFTIDRTPPTVSVQFPEQLSSRTAPAGVVLPVLAWPGRFNLLAKDTLSGVKQIEYWIDQDRAGQHVHLADGANLHGNQKVAATNQHSLHYSVTDVADNEAHGDVQFIVDALPFPTASSSTGGGARVPPPPGHASTPTSTPEPTVTSTTTSAQPCPVAVNSAVLVAVGGALTWSAKGACAPYKGTIVATYSAAGGVDCSITPCIRFPPRHSTASFPIPTTSALSGSAQDSQAANWDSVSYKLTLTDAGNHTVTAIG